MATLPAGFVKQMFKASTRTSKNLGRMSSKDMRAEYTRQAKVANKRISALERSGMYSPAVENLKQRGITRFGIKNQALMTDKEVREAYKGLMDFLGSSTSSRSGVRATADKMIRNFGLSFNGNYTQFTQKARTIFDLYEDLQELARQGQIKTGDKYDVINDLGTLYDAGIIDDETTAGDIIAMLKDMASERATAFKNAQSQLKFQWNV